jgi:BirA family transcriptional regulator, biotin operon repressor / biotin---[acetyl-CoA-carboxylase] ligase
MSLSSSAIAASFNPIASHMQVEIVSETGSTNQDLLLRAATLAAPTALIAEKQTAGRGRAGRSWQSTGGDVLTFSLAWRFECGVQGLLGLPLAVGVALSEALGELGLPVQLKWPNDLLRDGKKLAGILIETQTPSANQTWAVIGIGLNLSIPSDMEQLIGQAVADAPWLARMDRNELIANLLNALAAALKQFGENGFGAFAQRWNAKHAFANQMVNMIEAGNIVQSGIALGVDKDAALLLDTGSAVVRVLAGDVSLRLA